MNLVDCHVTEVASKAGPASQVTGPPRELYGKWWVPVNYESWGCPGNSEIMCNTLEEADAVKVGDVFQQ